MRFKIDICMQSLSSGASFFIILVNHGSQDREDHLIFTADNRRDDAERGLLNADTNLYDYTVVL